LEIPALETELDRALWQVERDLAQHEKQQKETESIRATAKEEKQESSDDKKSQ
jgi:cell division protein FtsB